MFHKTFNLTITTKKITVKQFHSFNKKTNLQKTCFTNLKSAQTEKKTILIYLFNFECSIKTTITSNSQ